MARGPYNLFASKLGCGGGTINYTDKIRVNHVTILLTDPMSVDEFTEGKNVDEKKKRAD